MGFEFRRRRQLSVSLSRPQAIVFGGAGVAGGVATAAIALVLWQRLGRGAPGFDEVNGRLIG